jgi:hypothetical protein
MNIRVSKSVPKKNVKIYKDYVLREKEEEKNPEGC